MGEVESSRFELLKFWVPADDDYQGKQKLVRIFEEGGGVMASYKELKARADDLLRQAEELRKQEIVKVINDIRAKMDEYGILPSDLGDQRIGIGRKSRKVTPKFRDPLTGKTWSGRGKPPRWLAAYESSGRKKDEFRI